MAKSDESKHPRDKGGKFTDGSKTYYRQNASYEEILAIDRKLAGTIARADSGQYISTNPKQFYESLLSAKQTLPPERRWRVADDHTEADYAHDKLIETYGGSTVAVTPKGNIISVCRNINDSVRGKDLLKKAVEEGGNRLDAFGEGLYMFYTKQGFTPVSWTPFNSEYAPHDWMPEYGEEPVIFYKYTGEQTDESYNDFINRVKPHDSYDKAMDFRDEEMLK